jgi:hypothetical protein
MFSSSFEGSEKVELSPEVSGASRFVGKTGLTLAQCEEKKAVCAECLTLSQSNSHSKARWMLAASVVVPRGSEVEGMKLKMRSGLSCQLDVWTGAIPPSA